MKNIVFCGEKGRHLEIPEGWRKLNDDEIVTNYDKVANIRKRYWMEVDEEDLGMNANAVGDHVIRKCVIIN